MAKKKKKKRSKPSQSDMKIVKDCFKAFHQFYATDITYMAKEIDKEATSGSSIDADYANALIEGAADSYVKTYEQALAILGASEAVGSQDVDMSAVTNNSELDQSDILFGSAEDVITTLAVAVVKKDLDGEVWGH